jgi:multisubunit Na+/H+ antiporter MnhE subunit
MQHAQSVIRPAGWALFLGAIYLLFASQSSIWEIIAGAATVTVALVAVAAVIIASPAHSQFKLRIRWLGPLRALPAHVVCDCAVVISTLPRRIIHPRKTGVFRATRFDPRDATRRALVITSASLAPNTFVVSIDNEAKLILLHQLVRDSLPILP